MSQKYFLALLALLVLFASRDAWATTFDPAGNLSFDPQALVTEGFETIAPQTGLTIQAADATHTALEGTKFANVNTTQSTVTIPITLPKKDGSFRARFFARTSWPASTSRTRRMVATPTTASFFIRPAA